MGELPSCEGRDQETNAELLPSDTLLRSLGGNGLSTRHNKNCIFITLVKHKWRNNVGGKKTVCHWTITKPNSVFVRQ